MLAHRLRRWANIKPTLNERFVSRDVHPMLVQCWPIVKSSRPMRMDVLAVMIHFKFYLIDDIAVQGKMKINICC